MTARWLFVCSGLLLFANLASGAGAYQRTKDGKTLVWNNYPRPGDEATWSGKRDADGYATGRGTLTWFGIDPSVLTGSNIPSKRRTVVLGTYSGNMVRGKFEGPVVNVDPQGKTFQLTFINGSRAAERTAKPEPTVAQQRSARVEPKPATEAPAERTAKPEPSVAQQRSERVEPKPATEAPAEGPSPAPEPKRNKRPSGGVIVEAPTRGDDVSPQQTTSPTASPITVVAVTPPRTTASSPPSHRPEFDQAVKDRLVTEFKQQTEAVLSQVGDATSNFREIDRFDSVQELPATISKNVGSLKDLTRDFRTNPDSETALNECRAETAVADALSVVDQITRDIATNDASEAHSKLSDFLKNNPAPIADSQTQLWHYLTSVKALCARLEKEAEMHVQRAQSLAAANRTSEAIREYQEAYRTFPNPATAGKIRQLQDNSLGL